MVQKKQEGVELWRMETILIWAENGDRCLEISLNKRQLWPAGEKVK